MAARTPRRSAAYTAGIGDLDFVPAFTPANRQRKLEVLALYAQSAPGEPISKFFRRINLPLSTFYSWISEDWDFRDSFSRVQQARQKVDLEPFERHLRAIAASVVREAVNGDVAAARIVLESLGHLRGAGATAVAVAGASASQPPPEALTDEQIAELLDRRKEMLASLQRFADTEATIEAAVPPTVSERRSEILEPTPPAAPSEEV